VWEAVKKRFKCNILSVQFSETVIVPVIKSIARQRLVENVVD
jgi:hypothetical protein